MRPVTGEIIAIGSELLLGDRAETNSLFLADLLAEQGIQVQWKTIVGDVLEHICTALVQAVRRADVVVLTGGLGSTRDDCTRQAVAQVIGRPLRLRASTLQALKATYVSYGRPINSRLRRQALIPVGAVVLENSMGTAPGFLCQWKNRLIVALPGVPHEAKTMFTERVVPRLVPPYRGDRLLEQWVFHTFGLSESDLEERLTPVVGDEASVDVGFLASPLGVTVFMGRWKSKHVGVNKVHQGSHDEFAGKAGDVRRILGQFLYSEQKIPMEVVVGSLLSSGSFSLAVAESCTGGLIGHRLTQVPGSSHYVDRVCVCYSNEAKQDVLHVPATLIERYGAVSRQVADAMAYGVRTISRTQIGLSVTGIAGPDGGTRKKPVGLVYVGLDGGHGPITRKYLFHGDRSSIKLRASQAAMDVLRRYLLRGKRR